MSGFPGAQAILLLLVHLVGDFYGGLYAPLVPYLRERLGLSLTATAGLATLLMGTMSYFQPAAGMLGERFGRRTALVAGVLAAAIGMCALGIVWNFPSLCAALVIGGLGVGLFHPIGAAVAGRNSSPGNRVSAIAVYMVGGNFGVMLAPLVVSYVASGALSWVAALALPGLIFAVVLRAGLKAENPGTLPSPPGATPRTENLWRVFRRLWPIHLDVVLRFIAINSFAIMLPLYCTLRGMSKAQGGQSLAFLMLVGAAGVLSGGPLAARFPHRALTIISEAAAGVCWVLAPLTTGLLFYVLLGAGSFLAYAVTPLQIAAAQRLAPRTESAASGIVMGLAGGNASLALLPLGWLGDHWTATTGSELVSVARMLQVSATCLFVAAAATICIRSAGAARNDGKITTEYTENTEEM